MSLKAPCYQHDSYHSECSSCVELNRPMTHKPHEQPVPVKSAPPNRKVLSGPILEQAKGLTISPAMAWDQRVSWLYGEMSFDNPEFTREMAIRVVVKIYGPRPNDD